MYGVSKYAPYGHLGSGPFDLVDSRTLALALGVNSCSPGPSLYPQIGVYGPKLRVFRV